MGFMGMFSPGHRGNVALSPHIGRWHCGVSFWKGRRPVNPNETVWEKGAAELSPCWKLQTAACLDESRPSVLIIGSYHRTVGKIAFVR